MDLYMIADTVTISTKHGLGFSKFILPEKSASPLFLPIDALAPPPVKSNSSKTLPRTLLRKKRRTRRRSSTGGDDNNPDDGADAGFFGDGGDCDGPFGGGGNWSGGGGGKGWNFDGFEGQNWDDFSSNSSSSWSGSAFNFVYEVVCWIALSNCVHFGFKKVVRMVTDGEREKVSSPIRLTSIC